MTKGKMLWRLTLAVALMFGGIICNCVKADVMSRLMLPRDYGVKLCGREFIRAVIFTCGGSRWKRSTEREFDPFQSISLSDSVSVEDNNQQTWQPGSELGIVPSYYSLADLLALYEATGGGGNRQLRRDPLEMAQLSTVLSKQDSNPAAAGDWPVPFRTKRNFSLGVAGKCCNQGCTKNDIGRLC